MSSLSIRSMHRSMDLRETISEYHWAEIKARRERNIQERQELLEKIETYGFATEEAFDKWYDEAPDANFLEYCRAEWARIVGEIEFAHKLAGHKFIVHQNAALVSTLTKGI